MAQVPPSLISTAKESSIVIGGITLARNEHPIQGDLDLGPLAQQKVIHTLPGGARLIQLFGIDPQPMTLSGTLWDNTAKPRSDYLRGLCASGKPVMFSYQDERYEVVVSAYTPKPYNPARIAYSMTMDVSQELSGKFASQSAPLSIDTQTNTAFDQASGVTTNITTLDTSAQAQALMPSVNTLGSALQNAGPISSASPSDVAAITSSAGALATQATAYQTALGAVINAASGGVLPQKEQTLYYYATRLVSLAQIISVNSVKGQAPSVVTVSGPTTLWELASLYYKNPNQAATLQRANNITGMQIPAGKTLTLRIPPPLDIEAPQ